MVEKGEETSTRKLSQPERHDRYVRQVEKLKGITIKGITEPSDGLVDICCSIFPESACEGFFVKKQPLYYIFTPSHLLIYIFTPSHLQI